MTVRSRRSTSVDYIRKSHPQEHVADHISKDTWHNQTMTSVKLIHHFRYVEITNSSDTWKMIDS
jgi:hypothetical protein